MMSLAAFAFLSVTAFAQVQPEATAAKPVRQHVLTPEERLRLETQRARLQEASTASPKDPELWRQLGLTYQALGDASGAKGSFEQVVALLPADAPGHFMLALALEKLQDPRAVSEWELCLQHSKDPKMAETAKRHIKHLRGR